VAGYPVPLYCICVAGDGGAHNPRRNKMTAATATARPARYFAVTGGHVHTEGCGHASAQRIGSRKTVAQHLVELDGKTHAEVAAIVGDCWCAHCFYNAPRKCQGVKLTASDMYTLSGKKAAAAQRAAERAAKRAARRAAESDELLTALKVAFEAAKAIADHDTAGVLYGQICNRRAVLAA